MEKSYSMGKSYQYTGRTGMPPRTSAWPDRYMNNSWLEPYFVSQRVSYLASSLYYWRSLSFEIERSISVQVLFSFRWNVCIDSDSVTVCLLKSTLSQRQKLHALTQSCPQRQLDAAGGFPVFLFFFSLLAFKPATFSASTNKGIKEMSTQHSSQFFLN